VARAKANQIKHASQKLVPSIPKLEQVQSVAIAKASEIQSTAQKLPPPHQFLQMVSCSIHRKHKKCYI